MAQGTSEKIMNRVIWPMITTAATTITAIYTKKAISALENMKEK